MNPQEKKRDLRQAFTHELMEMLRAKMIDSTRTFGFEYEFLSKDPIGLQHMERLYKFLPTCDFEYDGDQFCSPSGLSIAFEPGGQIEYHSPPLYSGDTDLFRQLLSAIEETNDRIKDTLGIEYIGTGYLPGRGTAPLCLTSDRYKNLHNRMSVSGSRGREMMKGTASIHLHVVLGNMDELPVLYFSLCQMAESDAFKMSLERRDIWDNTDPCRCGLPEIEADGASRPEKLIEKLVEFTLAADVIDKNIPFVHTGNHSFDAFLYHMTTIFTDVRLNIKGPTIELRTLDSMPVNAFERKWKMFISKTNNNG